MKVFSVLPIAFIGLTLSGAALFPSAGAVEIHGYGWTCQEKNQICFWHKAMVSPPRGWIEDEAWTHRYQAMVMFENGDKRASKPVMYLRAHAGENTLALEDYIQVAQARWAKRSPGAEIEILQGFERPGKPLIKVYLYKNPSVADQAFELTAFMKDVDSAHPEQTYFLQAVLSTPDMKELERAKPAFYELLGKI